MAAATMRDLDAALLFSSLPFPVPPLCLFTLG